ncbi:hypothetical protein QYE76_057534 [Lolium multiflorum]|uniref:Endonuclease/exonuclease/phosphatase domain-containing protein n=1 Tax=Lolium multiflorum TaxID=4521 RepID=A0AAD8T584_LOLMU|nr:hypothetical protein QYE76_057534 [Lolium multiflorum]
MKPKGTSLGRNPLSDAPHRNPGVVSNGQGPGRHPLGGAPYLDLDTVISEQGSGRRILSGALHRLPGVVKNEQGSPHLTRRVRRVRKLAEPRRIRLGSWNVGSLTGKLRELVDTAVRRRVDVLCVQETKWKGQKAKEVDDTGFKLWYTGTTSNKNGVGILVNKSLRDGVVDVKRQGDRMILVKLVVGDLVLNVISAYAPQVGHNESTKREFWEGLEDLVRRVPIGEKLFIGGGLNGHVGTSNTGFERVHGGFGYGIRNQEGEDVLSFALAYDMVVANTLFRKRESHLVTFSSGLHSSQIDFVLSRREDRRACIDCKVIPGESVVPQHKLVVADFRFRIRVQRGKRAKVARTKWWKLKGEASQAFRERVIKEGPWEEGGDANMMWTSMATCLRKVAVEEFGVTKGSRREAKDTWWWNDEVQKVIREKKDCFRCLYLDRSAANMEKYKVVKKAAKRAVSEARGRAYEDLYQRLNTKEGERDIYKMAKFRERKTRDVNEVKCIKDEDDQLLVKDEAIKRRWREYFDNLYNGEAESSTIELDDSFDDTSMCFVRRIQESEVKEALRRMKGGKAMGPDENTLEKRRSKQSRIWVSLPPNAGALQVSPPRNRSKQLMDSLPARIFCQRPSSSHRGRDHLVARRRRASATKEQGGLHGGGCSVAAISARDSRGTSASSLDEHMQERISPISSILAGFHRQIPTSLRTTKGRERENRQQQNTTRTEKAPLIERGLTITARSGQPPPHWRGGTPWQSPPDAAEKHQIAEPERRENKGLIVEDAWCPSPPPPHSLPPETNGGEEEKQEHPDPAHRIWIPSSGITPRHSTKPARSITTT